MTNQSNGDNISIFDNSGLLDNSGRFNNFATFNNQSGGAIDNFGVFDNYATFNNEGRFNITSGARLVNFNSNVFNNSGIVDNDGAIFNNFNDEGGTLTGSGILNQRGSFLTIDSGIFRPEGFRVEAGFNLDGGTLELLQPGNTLLTVEADANLNSGTIDFGDLSGLDLGSYTLIDGESSLNINAGLLSTAENIVDSFDTDSLDFELIQQDNDLVITVEASNGNPTAEDDSFTTNVEEDNGGGNGNGNGNNGNNGNNGDDNLVGTGQKDTIDGGRGNDFLTGGDGDDTFRIFLSDEGVDTIEDFMVGEDRIRIFEINAGDTITFSSDRSLSVNDTTIANVTTDSPLQRGSFEFFGNFDNEGIDPSDLNINIDSGDDGNNNGGGDDNGNGNGNNPTNGDDNLVGTNRKDTIDGGAGNDTIDGGKAKDLLIGGLGSDSLIGGRSGDTFVLTPGEGTDTIADFQFNRDVIGLSDGLSFDELSLEGDKILANGDTLAVLSGFDTTSLDADDFTTV